ncbi:hypothetical protein [Azospirillum endophyticum]
MINLASSQALSYQYQGKTYTIQVYADYSDANVHYILPQPVIPTGADGLPVFSLTSYNNGKAITGQCNFQTVLQTPPGAVDAVKGKFPGTAIGAWSWTGGTAWFDFQYPDETGALQSFSQVAWPSLQPTVAVGPGAAQASGQAAWTISLPSQAAVDAFIAAFSKSGAFSVAYQMQVEGSLPGVDVTVSFNSQTAYQFEQKVSVKKNVWGDVTSRTVTINQYLQQSQAGSIVYVWGAIDPLSALGQQITNWANQTLQNQLNLAVSSTLALLEQNQPQGSSYTFSINQVASFSTHYSQNTVVNWWAKSQTQLAAFSESEWSRLFHTVTTAPLTVIFSLENTSLDANGIDSITIAINTPVAVGSGTLTNAVSTWTFEGKAAPGSGGIPDYDFSYTYTVAYKNGTSWKSGTVTGNAAPGSADRQQTLNPGKLRALAVSFTCKNVKFGKGPSQVDYAEVYFSFTNPNPQGAGGSETKTETLSFTANDQTKTIQFYTALPYNTLYTYSVKYVLGDGSWVTLAPTIPNNLNTVLLNSPLWPQTVYVDPYWVAGMSDITVRANWVDPNNITDIPPHIWRISSEASDTDDWTFQAPNNPNAYLQVTTAQYRLGGKTVRYPVPWSLSPPVIDISSTETPNTVTVDPSLIDWSVYDMVTVDIYLKKNSLRQQGTALQFTKGVSPKFWTFWLDGVSPELNWYFEASYFANNRPTLKIPSTLVQSNLLVLPEAITPLKLRSIEGRQADPASVARELEAAHARLWPGLVNLAKLEELEPIEN